MSERKIDDPETWTSIRNTLGKFIALMAAEAPSGLDLTSAIAEADRSLAAMRDAGLSEGQAAVMTMLSYEKSVLALPQLALALLAIHPLGPSLLAAAVLMEILDAQG